MKSSNDKPSLRIATSTSWLFWGSRGRKFKSCRPDLLRMHVLRNVTLLGLLSLCSPGLLAGDVVNSELPWHEAVVDPQGKLLAWYDPAKNLGYDRVLHLAWDFIEHKIPNDPKSGLKVYIVCRL